MHLSQARLRHQGLCVSGVHPAARQDLDPGTVLRLQPAKKLCSLHSLLSQAAGENPVYLQADQGLHGLIGIFHAVIGPVEHRFLSETVDQLRHLCRLLPVDLPVLCEKPEGQPIASRL